MKKSAWKTSAVALAATLALGLPTTDALALALGRVNVQSALGEPFRAEIDIPEINPEEVASLRASVGSASAFRAAGMELSPTIANLAITLQRRADGRYFLRLTSDRAVNDPFLDLVLEASWTSGRLVRDYTLLFDPPNLRQGSASTATAQASPVAPPGIPAATPASRLPQRAAALPPAERIARVTPPPATAATPAARAPAGEGQKITVQPGDTAGRIAASNKPATISLDQMLVALLRANPEAFIAGNVNRLKAGAVLDLPSADQAGATDPGEARQQLVAQSRDFNEFRRRLAEGAPAAAVNAADRSLAGRVQAQVDEKTATAGTPDKLTLSKGAAQDRAAAETVARDRAAQDAATRVAELNKNLAELNKLSTGVPPGATPQPAASSPAPGTAVTNPASTARTAAAPAVPAPAAPGVAVPGLVVPPVLPGAVPGATSAGTPAPTATVAPAPAGTPGATGTTAVAGTEAASPATVGGAAPADAGATAPAPEGAAAPADGASNPAAVTAPAPAVLPPAPVETSLVDDLLQNPWMPVAAGGLLALLLGFGLYRVRQRKKAGQIDSSFLESRVQPDSFFGASGGQRIDTAQGGSAAGSSMVYSASQLDAAGDVDPVAEADVYLAYGRDLQAEEILREALRTNPERVAIHSKLLEIYAKRREVQAFGKAAEEAFTLTHGVGAEWEHICTLGREIDPANALYRPGGQPADGSGTGAGLKTAAVTAAAAGAAGVAAASHAAPPAPALSPFSAMDLDLDLSPSSTAKTSNLEGADRLGSGSVPLTAAMPSQFGAAGPGQTQTQAQAQAPMDFTVPDLDFSVDSFDLDDEPVASSKPSAAGTTPAADGMIEFDLSSLSLDLDQPVPPAGASGDAAPGHAGTPSASHSAFLDAGGSGETDGDPLATKLALAEEFSAIGDPDGARSLAEEVRAEASGDLKGRAERFLAELS